MLKVFEHRVMRRIFEPKKKLLTGEWRRFHYEELHGLQQILFGSSNQEE